METDRNYETFRTLPDWERMKLASENRIINTDTYNRTMNHLRGPEGWREEETYILQMRRSPFDYLVVAGIEDAVAELTSRRITQDELDFAEAFYRERSIPFFNQDMWQAVIDEHDGELPITVHGATDGTVVLPGEPLLRVTGPGELIAHFEHLFHRPFYSTLVATKAHEITQILGDPSRFIEVGKRGTPDELTHLAAIKAMQIGGGINLTSNDAGAAVFENVQAVGTIGHRYVQRFLNVETAFRHAVDNLDAVSLLVDLVDSYQGLDLALELKEEYRDTGKKIWVRLDSGDIKAQLLYYLQACRQRGFTDPSLDKIVVEGIESLDDIRELEVALSEDEKQRVVYGAGGLLVSHQTSRSDASTGFKMSEYEYEGALLPSMKFSDSAGKHSIPGKPTIITDGQQRMVAQAGEIPTEMPRAQDLLAPLYAPRFRRPTTQPHVARERCVAQYEALLPLIEAKTKSPPSPETAKKIGAVMCQYGLPQEEPVR